MRAKSLGILVTCCLLAITCPGCEEEASAGCCDGGLLRGILRAPVRVVQSTACATERIIDARPLRSVLRSITCEECRKTRQEARQEARKVRCEARAALCEIREQARANIKAICDGDRCKKCKTSDEEEPAPAPVPVDAE